MSEEMYMEKAPKIKLVTKVLLDALIAKSQPRFDPDRRISTYHIFIKKELFNILSSEPELWADHRTTKNLLSMNARYCCGSAPYRSMDIYIHKVTPFSYRNRHWAAP